MTHNASFYHPSMGWYIVWYPLSTFGIEVSVAFNQVRAINYSLYIINAQVRYSEQKLVKHIVVLLRWIPQALQNSAHTCLSTVRNFSHHTIWKYSGNGSPYTLIASGCFGKCWRSAITCLNCVINIVCKEQLDMRELHENNNSKHYHLE